MAPIYGKRVPARANVAHCWALFRIVAHYCLLLCIVADIFGGSAPPQYSPLATGLTLTFWGWQDPASVATHSIRGFYVYRIIFKYLLYRTIFKYLLYRIIFQISNCRRGRQDLFNNWYDQFNTHSTTLDFYFWQSSGRASDPPILSGVIPTGGSRPSKKK